MTHTITAGFFIINKNNKLLICHPTNNKLWSIPKGKVDEGETILQAAIRETFEETNIDISTYKTIIELEPMLYGHRYKTLHSFMIREQDNDNLKWGDFEIKCNSNVPIERGGFPEMDDYRWVSIDEAKTLLHETQVKCLELVKEFLEVSPKI